MKTCTDKVATPLQINYSTEGSLIQSSESGFSALKGTLKEDLRMYIFLNICSLLEIEEKNRKS